jgi:hypothetical protein
MTDEDLTAALRALPVPELLVDPTRIAEVGRRRRRHRRAAAGGAVAALSAFASVIVLATGPGAPPQVLVPAGPGLDQASIDERTVDGLPALACGGLAALSALTATPGAETADTPEARGLRKVITDDPSGGASTQTPHGWVLLQRNGDQVTYGQRQGRVGLGAIVTVQRRDDRYVFGSSGGCGPVGYADGRTGMPLDTWSDRGDHLVINYGGDSCDLRHPSVHVHETAASVDVLVVTPKPLQRTSACGGVGLSAHLDVPLLRPVGGRLVRNIAYLPAVELLSTKQDAAQRRADQTAHDTVTQLCAGLGGRVDAAYVSDVASVRNAVPTTRQPWAHLTGDTVAADCWIRNPDASRRAVVAAAGVPSVTRTRRSTAGLLDRVPETAGRRYR